MEICWASFIVMDIIMDECKLEVLAHSHRSCTTLSYIHYEGVTKINDNVHAIEIFVV